MEFNKWVDKVGGIEKAALKLKMPLSTVTNYYEYRRLPNALQLVKIHRTTKGRIDYYRMALKYLARAARSK